MGDERWRKMVVLDHGVRERFGVGGVMSKDGNARSWRERERERKDWECLRRVGQLVWEGIFGVEVDCVKKCLIKSYFD